MWRKGKSGTLLPILKPLNLTGGYGVVERKELTAVTSTLRSLLTFPIVLRVYLLLESLVMLLRLVRV